MEGSVDMGSADTASDLVLVSVDGGVADVRLNRPDKLNALTGALMAAIVDAGEALKGDRSVRAVVLSGSGRGFCAGLDLGAFQAMAGGGGDGDGGGAGAAGAGAGGIMRTDDRITHLGQQAGWVWQELEVPVIAAIAGPCLGGGLQIALGADIRIAAPDAKLSVLEMRWGLIPDMIGTWVLPRLVGLDVAKELTITGRMLSGEEAAALGVVTRVAEDPHAAAIALAREVAGKSPVAVRHAKRLLNASVEPGRTPAEQFLDERATMGSLIGSSGNIESVTAYFEKRDPVYED
jgi:enoyl-CoA hydratase/carnithine racemase